MKTKDFIRLPLGAVVEMTDGICNYKLRKKLTDDGRPIYSITELRSMGHFCLFEYDENVFEDSDKFKYKSLRACTHVGALAFHSTDTYSLRRLKIIPKSSYLKTFPS